MKKRSGLTLIETIVSVTVLAILILGVTLYLISRQENLRAKLLSSDMVLLLGAVDKKMQLDAFDTSSWKKSTWANKDAIITDLVGKELRTTNSSCGKPDGWKTDLVKEPLTLIPCSNWAGNTLPFNLESKASFQSENSFKSGEKYISMFNIDYYFSNKTDFENNFRLLLKTKNALEKYEYSKNITTHTYDWINRSNDTVLNLEECLKIQEKCGLRTQIEAFSGISTDKIRVDGKNPLMGEIDFNNADTSCSEWTKVSLKWVSKPVKCTILGGFDSNNDNLVVAYMNTSNISDRVSLEKICTLQNYSNVVQTDSTPEKWTSTTEKFPCGLSKNGSIIQTGFDESHANSIITMNVITNKADLKILNIKEDAKFYNNLKSDTINASKSLDSKETTVNTLITNMLDIVSTGATNNMVKFTIQQITRTPYFESKALYAINNLITASGVSNLNTSTVKERFFVKTKDSSYVNSSTDTNVYKRTVGTINNNITSSNNFYSGVPDSQAATGIEGSYNTLTINDVVNNVPNVIGTSKADAIIRKEIGNIPNITDMDVAIYKDSHNFFSDPNSILKVNKLTSQGNTFTLPAVATAGTNPSYSVKSDNILATQETTLKGSVSIGRHGVPAITISNSGRMVITGFSVPRVEGGTASTADLAFAWPTSTEDNPGHNGFRPDAWRSSFVPIVLGQAVIIGNVIQDKPFHMNERYKGTNIKDHSGLSMVGMWNNLNSIQSYLQGIESQYQQVFAKLPPKRGDQGDSGEQGFNGAKGKSGLKGIKGVRGPDGPMAYLK